MSLGSMITKARKDAGLSIDALSESTNLRATLLREIEDDNFLHCGGEAYARGHVRNIATKLSIDPAIFIAAFEEEQVQVSRSIRDLLIENSIMKKKDEPRKVSWKVLVTISVTSLLILGVAQMFFFNKSTDEITIPVASPTNLVSPTSSASPKQTQPDASATSSASTVEVTVIAARAKSWLFVSDASGTPLFSGQIAAGERKKFSANLSLNFKIGNAGGVDLIVNGKVIDSIGSDGEVVNLTYGVDS